MKPKGHMISSIPLGIGYYLATGDLKLSSLAAIATVAIDVDHVWDYIIIHRRIDSLKSMVDSYSKYQIDKCYMFLHSWELMFVSGIYLKLFPNPYLLAIFFGFLFHIICDQIYNSSFIGKYNVKPMFYFMFFRYQLNFGALVLRKSCS